MRANFEQIATISSQLNKISDDGLRIQDSPFEIATAFGTLAAVVVALFAVLWPSILKRWNRPKLTFEFDNTEPFCRHTFGLMDIGTRTTQQLNSYHIRLRIKNKGKSIARKCEGKLIAIAHKDLKTLRQDFDPVILHWVGSDAVVRNLGVGSRSMQFTKTSSLDINSKEYEYLDFLSTHERTDRFEIQAIDFDIPRGITLDPQKDDYFFLVTIYSENADPVSEVYKTIVGKKSYDDVQVAIANVNEKNKFYKLINL